MASEMGHPDRTTQSLSSRITQRLRPVPVPGFAQIAVIDQANQDYVSGWAFHSDGVETVEVFVDNRRVGVANYGALRTDVSLHDEAPDTPEVAYSGFSYLFKPEDLRGAPRGVVSVHVLCRAVGGGSCMSFPVEIPTASLPGRYLEDSSDEVSEPDRHILQGVSGRDPEGSLHDWAQRSPFPRSIDDTLRRLRGEEGKPVAPWTSRRIEEAIDDLILASEVASRDTAGLFWYFSYLREMWVRLEFNARHFPALNRGATFDLKDIHGVGTSPVELFVISHHLATLRSHGVSGSFCEFGCFKGFSTAALSEACFRLGMRMDVFDSFQGLPDTGSSLYRPGEFMGSLNEVRANVREFGNLAPVRFHQGFYSETVDLWEEERVACIWLDVDLEQSARDALQLFDKLEARSCVFSDECAPEDFIAGRIVEDRNPDRVVEPICDAFRQAGRDVSGVYVAGNMGCFRDPGLSLPVLMPTPLLRLKDALLK